MFSIDAFAAFPELTTTRLRLRALQGIDAPVIFSLYRDVRVMALRGEPEFVAEDQAAVLLFYWRKQFALGEGVRWGIELREEKKLIGTAGFKTQNKQHRTGEIGYELNPEYWNRGLMTEALQAITQFGLEQLNLHTITANIAPDHVASRRVLEKLGFVSEGLFLENYFYKNWWNSQIWVLHEKNRV
ncbi:MAG: GNAT family N-acetyltransferase [Bacteroidia bacterium]